MSVTIVDIAKHLGVAHSTVSRVLNNRGNNYISEGTRQRVMQAAEELGYQPNRLAKALVTGRSNMVALWMDAPYRPFYSEYGCHFQSAAEADQYKIVTNKYSATDRPISLKDLQLWPEDGLILVQDERIVDIPAKAEKMHPIVSVGGYDVEDVDCVYVDLRSAQEQVMAHLLSQGCKRIACIFSQGYDVDVSARAGAYKDLMLRNGLKPEFIFTHGYAYKDARQAFPSHIKEHGCPEAIFCFNDEMALVAHAVLYDLGYRVPDDVLLVGCDGIEAGEYMRPRLTTIPTPLAEICSKAWEFLKNRMENPEMPVQRTRIEPKLLIMDSSIRK